MDGLVSLFMQIFTIIFAVGTIGISYLVGKIWKKQKGY